MTRRAISRGIIWTCIAWAASGCPNDARDAKCTPDEPNRAANPDCIYAGTGKGPIIEEPACPAVEGDAPADCPSFYDVLDVLADPARGNCTSFGCHGAEVTAQTGIFLPVAEPAVFYENLLDAEGSVGRPYVVADDPDTAENESRDSWMVCNLLAEHGGGFPMPPPGGMPNPDDVGVVEDWILCGAPGPELCAIDADDGECLTCAKTSCCPKIVQCEDDSDCALCADCLQMFGDLASCAAACDAENARVDALTGCVSALCEEECPGVTG
ncbi:MAG: hypothetical protein HOW73_47310 [Polyangiaceae bacterium]|nr:hypothetical protein [Polyangiaceae bacterium]